MQITRNHLPTSGVVSRAEFDALGDIQVAFEPEDYAAIVAQVNDALGQGVAGQNYLSNADFALWSRGDGPLALSEGILTELADYWFARADYAALGSGGGGTFAEYSLDADVEHEQWLFCAKLSGAPGLTSVDLGQKLHARVTAALWPKCTLTLEIENQTGAAIIPVIHFETCDSFENYNSTTLRVSTALASIAAAATVVTTTTLDLTSYESQVRNGALLYVRFPGVTATGAYVHLFAAKLEVGSTGTTRVVERNTDAPTGGAGAGSASEQINYFPNPNLHRWQSPSIVCTEAMRNYGPQGFFVRPAAGNTLGVTRDTLIPDGASRYSAKLTGATAITSAVDFGAQLDLPTASETARQLVLSGYLYNNTGAPFTPQLLVDTCNSENTFNTVTNRLTQALPPCAAGAWTQFSLAINAAALTNWGNGAELYVRIPAGSLGSGQTLNFCRLKLEPGASPSTFIPKPAYDEPAAVNGSYASLTVLTQDGQHIGITASELVMKDGGGVAIVQPGFTASIDITTVGAGGMDYALPVVASTWHYIWLLSRSDAQSAILSQSATLPNLPDGYLYTCMVGAIFTTSGSVIPRQYQVGKRCYAVKVNAFSTTLTADDTWENLPLTTFVPPMAVSVFGTAGCASSSAVRLRIAADDPTPFAANTPGIGEVVLHLEPNSSADYNFYAAAPFEVPILTPVGSAPPTIWFAAGNHTATYRIDVAGWMMP